MRRSAVLRIFVCLTLTAGALGVVPGGARAQEIAGSAVTVPGVEAAAAVAGATPAAAAGAFVVNQSLTDNRVDDISSARSTRIVDSLHDNAGIFNVNQTAENVVNQANVVVVTAVSDGAGLAALVQTLDTWAAGAATNNTVVATGTSRENLISNSFDRTVGITSVNQSTGNLNQQLNATVLAFGVVGSPGELALLQDATLGEVSADNNVVDDRVAARVDQVLDSFRHYRGAALVSQVSGEANVVRNGLTISVIWITDSLTLSATVPTPP